MWVALKKELDVQHADTGGAHSHKLFTHESGGRLNEARRNVSVRFSFSEHEN